MRREFPNATYLHLPGYGVRYGKRGVMLRLLAQIPVIRRHIFTEHAWLQQAIRQHKIDGVISDNRYGLYSSEVPSVIITHQLQLQMPAWAKFFRSGIRQLLYQHIGHFGACWVPDLQDGDGSLAGDMSHPPTLPAVQLKYIGWLSRFERPDYPPLREDTLLISLSGPEPQRSLLEEKVLQQASQIDGTIWLVRGLPGQAHLPPAPPNVTVHNHLPSSEMQDLMLRCKLLIARSGYSTLMDALALHTPIACVPTPGQTEQEYLARRLSVKGWAVHQSQENFSLSTLVKESEAARIANMLTTGEGTLSSVLKAWLSGTVH